MTKLLNGWEVEKEIKKLHRARIFWRALAMFEFGIIIFLMTHPHG